MSDLSESRNFHCQNCGGQAAADGRAEWLGASASAIRIPGVGGAALIITPVSTTAPRANGELVVDIAMIRPDRIVCYRKRKTFMFELSELCDFLHACMVDDFPEVSAPLLQWPSAGLHLSVPISYDTDVDLLVTLTDASSESGELDPDAMRFTTSRAALWEPVDRLSAHAGLE